MIAVLNNYLVVGAILFTLGGVGFLTRRNFFLMILSAEMMLQGVSLTLVAFGRYHGNFSGQAFTVFVLTVAACEAAIGLALVLTLYQRRHTLDISVWKQLGEPATEPASLSEPADDAAWSGEPSGNGHVAPQGHGHHHGQKGTIAHG